MDVPSRTKKVSTAALVKHRGVDHTRGANQRKCGYPGEFTGLSKKLAEFDLARVGILHLRRGLLIVFA
jgi:hypothetical protein